MGLNLIKNGNKYLWLNPLYRTNKNEWTFFFSKFNPEFKNKVRICDILAKIVMRKKTLTKVWFISYGKHHQVHNIVNINILIPFFPHLHQSPTPATDPSLDYWLGNWPTEYSILPLSAEISLLTSIFPAKKKHNVEVTHSSATTDRYFTRRAVQKPTKPYKIPHTIAS